ncbi:beta-ketoacyl-[acyl-carrier-protein] synthase family protein [Aquimarina aquimarini]|uniref:beta-ketoacyl-[acyl-carrier-protein] synthase family protein n=1 Tax=Aquimarina aquimarini TaxID=1191734 RepID=UPI000D55D00F|nr:beta-ketoacyl synthase N-terminal-like domain-containing protein [Aquimarina aquimarini]
MSKVYLSYNNITSPLGFDSETVVKNIHHQKSGLRLINDKNILPVPFYSAIIPSKDVSNDFERLNISGDFTRLEKMMISSLSKVIKASNKPLTDRTGLIISTTKGNIDVLDKNSTFSKERANLSTLGKVIKNTLGFKNETIVVSNACVSGILSVAIAKRYINQGIYDDVFIVSGDMVTKFILTGFNSFQALSDTLCKPYDKDRTGVNIGEAIASVLVTNDKNELPNEAVVILGEGASNDANHISGPSRTGEGLCRSIESACKEAKVTSSDIDYISAHGTATLFNDETEAIAFNKLDMGDIPLNSLKGYFGHTLGASGLVETIIGMHSLYNNTLYASLGFDKHGTSKPLNIITKTTTKPLDIFIKTASGFGGCNTAAIFKKIK